MRVLIRLFETAVFIAIALLVTGAALAQDPCLIPPGEYKTLTMGGWGADACNGNNGRCALEAHFAAIYPSGVTVGGFFSLLFTSPAAIGTYEPAGGTAASLTASHTNPATTESGVLGGQVLALQLNVDFGNAGVAGFADIDGLLYLNPGSTFNNMTIGQLLTLANAVLGGELSGLPVDGTISGLNSAINNINNNFDNGTSSNGWVVLPGCDLLAVELIGFEAISLTNAVSVRWSTASETDNARFDLDRSTDALNWSIVASMPGQGTLTTRSDYRFDDTAVETGVTYFYRLSSVDLNGAIHPLGEMVSAAPVDALTPGRFALAQNYPNPFNPNTAINFTVGSAALVELTVINALGQSVAVLINESMSAGDYTISFDAAALPAGMYFYHLRAGDFSAVRKMLLLK